MMVGTKRRGDRPRCDDCGAWMVSVEDRRFSGGRRWDCPDCDMA